VKGRIKVKTTTLIVGLVDMRTKMTKDELCDMIGERLQGLVDLGNLKLRKIVVKPL
jgi:hypothetical protein